MSGHDDYATPRHDESYAQMRARAWDSALAGWGCDQFPSRAALRAAIRSLRRDADMEISAAHEAAILAYWEGQH